MMLHGLESIIGLLNVAVMAYGLYKTICVNYWESKLDWHSFIN